jgi:hypothetical protein
MSLHAGLPLQGSIPTQSRPLTTDVPYFPRWVDAAQVCKMILKIDDVITPASFS